MAGAATWFVSANLNESAKIDRMVSMSDGISGPGWEATSASYPKHDIGCIPFDHSCHSLFRVWETPEPEALDELVASTGYELQKRYIPGCAAGWVDSVHLQLCVRRQRRRPRHA